jgi:hypothetical protein
MATRLTQAEAKRRRARLMDAWNSGAIRAARLLRALAGFCSVLRTITRSGS